MNNLWMVLLKKRSMEMWSENDVYKIHNNNDK